MTEKKLIALTKWPEIEGYPPLGTLRHLVFHEEKNGFNTAMQPASVVKWFRSLYAELGYGGCSSHSGRRSFVTKAARSLHLAGGSLKDVQQLAGHRSLETTQAYIEGDSKAKRKLVSLL